MQRRLKIGFWRLQKILVMLQSILLHCLQTKRKQQRLALTQRVRINFFDYIIDL